MRFQWYVRKIEQFMQIPRIHYLSTFFLYLHAYSCTLFQISSVLLHFLAPHHHSVVHSLTSRVIRYISIDHEKDVMVVMCLREKNTMLGTLNAIVYSVQSIML